MKLKFVLLIAFVAMATAGAAYYLGVKSAMAPTSAGGTASVADTGAPGTPAQPDAPDAPAADPIVPELEAEVKALAADGYLYAIGVGESTDEMIARSVSIDNGRADVAAALLAQAGAGQSEVNAASSVRKTVTQYDKGSGRYRVYALVVQNKEGTRADSAKIEEVMRNLGAKAAN